MRNMDNTEISEIERRAQAAELALYDATHVLNRRIFETTLDLILVTDKRGSFIRVSPSSLSILGYEPAEMIGHSAEKFLYCEDLASTRDEMRQARRSGASRNFECRYVHKQGRIVTLWWTGVWSEIGENYFFIGRDVTEREESARKIRESEARLALAVDIAQIGVASAEPPTEPTQTDALFNGIYGRPLDTPTMSAGEWLALVHPGDRDRAATELLAIIRHGGLFTGDFRIKRYDTGEERWVRTVTRVDLDASGQPSRFLGVHTDITDHKRALTAIIDREALLALAMRIVGLGMAIAETEEELAQTDTQFRKIYGLPADKAEIGVNEWLQLLHPEDRSATAAAILRAITGHEPYAGEFRFRRPDTGEERWARALLQTVTNEEGRYGRSLSVHLDITERRQIEEQLRQTQKMEALGNLTGGMAHDFNNMLGVIIANLDLATEEVQGNEDAAELLKEATDAALSAAELTRRLLAFARRQPLRPEPIDINALVSNLVQLLRRVLGEDVEISLELASDLWTVIADAAQLESSLTNLAANARDAMPKGGRLSISTTNGQLDDEYADRHAEVTPGDYAVIAVTDSGTGMTPDVLDRIFEPFYTTKEVGKG
jgi:PAS domain S-box-containing protein